MALDGAFGPELDAATWERTLGVSAAGLAGWDPVLGCSDPRVASERARAVTAATVLAAGRTVGDAAARFYAAEAAKVVAAYFHAAALTGGTLVDVLAWAADPWATSAPETILRDHPDAGPLQAGPLTGVLRGDERTSASTIRTVQGALAWLLRCHTDHGLRSVSPAVPPCG